MNTLQPIKLPNMPRRKGLDVKAFCTLEKRADIQKFELSRNLVLIVELEGSSNCRAP